MPTRFYLPSSGSLPSGVTSATVGSGWEVTASFVQLATGRTKSNTPLANGTLRTKGTGTSNADRLDRVYVSEKLAAQTISGTFSAVIRAMEDSARALDAWLNIMIRVLSADGSTVKATLYAGTTASSESATASAENGEFIGSTTGMQTRIKSALTLASYTCADQDRLSFEIGWRANGTSTTATAGFNYGDPSGSADLGLTAGSSTAGVPWIELSQTLTPYTAAPPDGGGGDGEISLVVAAAAADADATVFLARPAGLATDDFLMLFHSWSFDGSSPAAMGNGFAQAFQDMTQGSGDPTSPNLRIYTKTVGSPGAEPADYAIPSGSGSDNAVVLAVLRGVDLTDPYALTYVGAPTSNDTEQTLTGRTIPEDNCLWIQIFPAQFFNASANTTWTKPAQATEIEQAAGTFNTILVAMEQRDAGATGDRTATVSGSGSAQRTGSLALRALPASGGAAPTNQFFHVLAAG